ncbi:unnamed protein product [Adineta steineri]|uniref:Uncharacterized protein n=1 Tax=Adineta steineri TaxID=433720 RepID=A0A813RY40_9BILA|nr:unnamed protein product [Adineta steineri]CAF1244077.1 unnamed protein product [Adineta steineri]
MSTEDEKKTAPPSILHFINPSDKKALPSIHKNIIEESSVDSSKMDSSSVHDSNTEITTENNSGDQPIKKVSHSRRVHFPIEDTELRLISYTPQPYARQPLLSLGVILQRYRAACQRLQIRPLNTLLDQLSTMDDGRTSFADRLDCLKIVNEKIDLKHIDAIEEILSRCRFHTLDFDSSSIDDSALTQLFEVLEYYESCTHINLSNNRSIGMQGYQALTKYLRKTNSLERLDMNTTRFDDNSIISFTRSLRLSTTLYELHVESCYINGKILQKFIQNIRTCSSLRELYLCDNRLQVQDSFSINELIRTCGPFLFLLDIRSNSLQDAGMSHLASQLSHYDENHKHENNLQKLSIQANQLTQQGVGFLAKALLHNRTIRSLNLSQNNITNDGLFLLRDALLTNPTVNELILRNCQLTDQAAIALAEYIAESSTIQYIDLRENNIQASGICGMAIAIKNNKSLLKLDFDPIPSTPTNLSSLSSNNNIDRNTNSTGFLSLASLRKMTTAGFSSFTSNIPSQSNMSGAGGGTRELLEQKARWMYDIAAVCQRNILIYEEKLRLLEEEQNKETSFSSNITKQKESTNNESKEETLDTDESNDNEHPTLSNQNNSEEIADPMDVSIKTIDEVEQSKDDSADADKENKQSLDDVAIKDDDDNNTFQQTINTSNNDHDHQVAQSVATSVDEVKRSVDTSINSDSNIEQTMGVPASNNHETEQSMTDPVELIPNGDNEESNQNSTFHESSSHSDPTDDTVDDDKRKIRHSDSLYLLRKKVKNENDDDTSDDESQLSSIQEQ